MASGKALYSIAVVVLGFICFVVGAIAVGLPAWGYFYSYDSDIHLFPQSYILDNPNFDHGYFGPWRVCKTLLYNREKCGNDVSKFRPSKEIIIPESDEYSDEDESVEYEEIEENEASGNMLPILLESNPSTPDLSDSTSRVSFDVTLKKEMMDKETNTFNNEQTEQSREDIVHECYAFSMLVAKHLCKMDEERRKNCMQEIIHLVMK